MTYKGKVQNGVIQVEGGVGPTSYEFLDFKANTGLKEDDFK